MAKGTLKYEATHMRTTSVHTSRGDEATAWFYEEPAGLLIVVEHKNADGWTTSQHRIPWGRLRSSVRRKDAAAERKEDDTEGGKA